MPARAGTGNSAIAIASLAIAQLVREGWHGLIVKGQHQGTSNVGVIRGGEATNVVTDHVKLKAEARSHDRQFRKQIVKVIEQAFKDAATQVHTTGAGRCFASTDAMTTRPFACQTMTLRCWPPSEPYGHRP